MAIVRLEGIVKRFGDVTALDAVSLAVQEHEMLCLLGPSGCGKTTLLRTIAGFATPTAGRVLIAEQDMTRVPPEKRNTALVFQNYALFPHMTVSENIAFGLKIRRWRMSEIKTAVQEILGVVGMAGLEDRWVRQLSGGQQQRVALARALVIRPSVLLLDEPLSNLDAKLRMEMRAHIRGIQRRVGITAVFVTHDQEEALTMADRIAIMNQGRIVQIGSPHEVYAVPSSTFVADFIGKSNCLQGRVEKGGCGCSFVLACGEKAGIEVAGDIDGSAVWVLRPEHLELVKPTEAGADQNAVAGTIEHITYLGEMAYYRVQLADGTLVTVAEYGRHVRGWKEGDEVEVTWRCDAGTILRA
ncbi:MAG: ABC transporter ATP-binding protein [Candidatus Bipolaricaulia bacterium]